MVKFVPTVDADRPLIESWIDADFWHSVKDAKWWTFGYLTFKLIDEHGITMFVRLDREGDLVRLHTQFAPVEEVSKKRVATAIMQAIPEFIPYAKLDNLTGIITESISERLVAFLKKLGFEHIAGYDYMLKFTTSE